MNEKCASQQNDFNIVYKPDKSSKQLSEIEEPNILPFSPELPYWAAELLVSKWSPQSEGLERSVVLTKPSLELEPTTFSDASVTSFTHRSTAWVWHGNLSKFYSDAVAPDWTLDQIS
ncbi:hypothetical protein AVEN_48245-1 [Araneus ventricosus]|uniref:Uncharacterized protein n=1 Tax=Araneus ventricosus TaxID=182803 RepID=A0A4Y2IY93_ARAVE|nr:hypothetical protein AVEN_48245-1 [Araneus ventricosus]